VHPYLITAKPGRWQRVAATAGRWTTRLLALTVMAVLGLVVFVIRSCRPVVNYVATRAVWLETWAARRTGLPPMGAALGEGLAEEFMREFRGGFAPPAPDPH
jgi:hypothetical protein